MGTISREPTDMFTNRTTAAAVAAQTIEAPASQVISSFKELAHDKRQTSIDHAVYALARLIYSFDKTNNTNIFSVETSTDFAQTALRKLVRTLPPVTRSSKIDAGGVAPFGALMGALNLLRQSSAAVRTYAAIRLTEQESEIVSVVARLLHVEARRIGVSGLKEYTVPNPVREKKPYTGPRS